MDEIAKLYYSIGEVSEMTGITTGKIRFYCMEFRIQTKRSAKGNRGGYRLFTINDIDTLNKIAYLVRVKRFTLEGARIEMKLNKL